MKKKYLVVPTFERDENGNRGSFLTANVIMGMYGVAPSECEIFDPEERNGHDKYNMLLPLTPLEPASPGMTFGEHQALYRDELKRLQHFFDGIKVIIEAVEDLKISAEESAFLIDHRVDIWVGKLRESGMMPKRLAGMKLMVEEVRKEK